MAAGFQEWAEVAEAIREERLYILTHPDFMGAVKTRMNDLLAGRTPGPFDLAAMTPPRSK